MELQRERSFNAGGGHSALALRLLASEAGQPPHIEDAFLADFARFVRAADPWPSRALSAIEVGRAALDLIDDVEGPWQQLPIEAWLDALARVLVPSSVEQLRLLARAFVEWLVMCGRLSLHGQRGLARRIVAWRVAGERADCDSRVAGERADCDSRVAGERADCDARACFNRALCAGGAVASAR